MMKIISRSDTVYIKSRVSIREVVTHYGMTLKNNKCRCPFHDEKTASFSVNDKKQIFKCFGCGKGGDVIQFVREYLKCDFQTAIEELNKEFHLGLDLEENHPAMIQFSEERQKQAALLDWFSYASFMLLMRYKQLKLMIESEHIIDLSDVSDGFLYAINHIDFVEYLLDCSGESKTISDKIKFYKQYHEETIGKMSIVF